MGKVAKIISILIVFSIGSFLFLNIADARSGCCSWHGGVCGCGCCDGTPLSATCAPYYPGCGGGGYSSGNSYNYNYPSIPSTPSCPLMSSYDSLSGSCKCFSGYVVDTDILGNQTCVSGNTKCTKDYGYGAQYNSLSKQCECSYGYVMSGGKCISGSTYCSSKIGLMSQYNSLSKTCECMVGYEFDGLSCVYKKTSYSYPSGYNESLTTDCPINSMPSPSDSTKCRCNIGFQANATGDGCELIPPKTCPLSSTLVGQNCVCNIGLVLKNNQCISHTEDCELSFGKNVVGTPGPNGNSSCNCASGYQWNSTKTSCQLLPEPIKLPPVSNPISQKENKDLIKLPEYEASTIENKEIKEVAQDSDENTQITPSQETNEATPIKSGNLLAKIGDSIKEFFAKIFKWSK